MGRIETYRTLGPMYGPDDDFGQNAGDLYSQYMGMADNAGRDRMATTMDYASNNVDAFQT